ncbi:unnamed protein product [Kuraishia capsulata CBS 1993]|uniref:Ubiquinone biosynthesis O-methyltransferase, mitochondrial n=1 Tax=Kuraishia capsulata CBS 1993 TaxID=1382522 RepID=W6MU69_9ASCO|nr:uncharacterized protein KUCA_T00004902001 [Kuraishia capsulata CBS 1993]CDK28917.1 unnamed protein product [Kuraishia capsulata CBS 1993]
MFSRLSVKSIRPLVSFRSLSSGLTSISPVEQSHFNQLASSWWDVNGPQRILHKMNLLRMDFITNTIKSHLVLNDYNNMVNVAEEEIYIPGFDVGLLDDAIADSVLQDQETRRQELLRGMRLKCLDIGCGGGIFSESMARLPYVGSVKGIDLSEEVLAVAKNHAALDPILEKKLSYDLQAVEQIDESLEQYDVVSMFEMLEHVDYPAEVLKSAIRLVKPGGWVFLSTINRDFISWFTTIAMGEYVLKIVPKGTHTHSKYINEKEIEEWFDKNPEFEVKESKGCVYLPAYGWKFTENEHVGNYFMAIKRVTK